MIKAQSNEISTCCNQQVSRDFTAAKNRTKLIKPAREARGPEGPARSGRGEDFLSRQPKFFTETAVTPERKVEKWFPRWEINRHVEG